MGKKPLQFQVPEKLRQDIERITEEKEITLSDFLRQSVRLSMILNDYIDQGYMLVLRKKDEESEKEIILP